MTLTILALLFLLTIVSLAVFGFRAIIRQGKSPEDANKEKCSVCLGKCNRGLPTTASVWATPRRF